jgi:peptidoglycan/LPS O-acetylase OafA/YrhL
MMDRLDPLTGLRGIAAYTVLLAHASQVSFVYSGTVLWFDVTSRIAYFGMSLFFVLSGFVIQYNYGPLFVCERFGVAVRRFYAARFARLYPLYAVTLLLAIQAIPSPHFIGATGAFVSYLTLTQSWFNTEMAAFVPAWSISAEWFFYLAFLPLTYLVTRLRHPLAALALFCTVAAAGLGICLRYFEPPLDNVVDAWLRFGRVSADPHSWLIYLCPYVRVLEFVAGMLAAKVFSVLPKNAPMPIGAKLVAGAAIFWCAAVIFGPLTQLPFLNELRANFIFAPALAVILICACGYKSWLGRALGARLLLRAGEISYSVYIWCWLMMDVLDPQFRSSALTPLACLNSTVKVATIIGLTTAVAYGSYLMIETPSRRWLRSILTPGALRSRFLAVQTGD